MLVNAHSSNHELNQEADLDLKWLMERDLLQCEQAPWELHLVSKELIASLDQQLH